MLKGLTTALKPCVRKITIEPPWKSVANAKQVKSQTDLYYASDTNAAADEAAVNGQPNCWHITFDVVIKSRYSEVSFKDIAKN